MQVGTALAIFALSFCEEVTGLRLGLLRCVGYRRGFVRRGWSLVRLNIRRIYGCGTEDTGEVLNPHTEFGKFGMSRIVSYKGHLLTIVPVRDELVDVAYIVAASKVDLSALCVINELSEQGSDLGISVFLHFASIDEVEEFV